MLLSTSLLNCFATDLATNLRNVVPVAIPRTPPSFFCRAVSVAIVKQCIALRGTVLPNQLLRGPTIEGFPHRRGKPSTFRSCSPQVLGLTQLELFGGKMQNIFVFNCKGTSGTNCITSSGISLNWVCGDSAALPGSPVSLGHSTDPTSS